MTQINNLNEITNLTSGDLLVSFQTSNGSNRKVSIGTLQNYLQSALSFGDFIPQQDTQYASPSASGFTVNINDNSKNIHLILTPISSYATGNIILPTTNLLDKQSVLVNSTQQITSISIQGGAASVIGAPTQLLQNGFFTLKYDIILNSWYRVG